MAIALVPEAAAIFAVTNIDDLLVLALFFGLGAGRHGTRKRVVVGQYLGFGGILAISLLAAAGVSLLPETAVAYFGLVPILLGIRAGWHARHNHVSVRRDAPLVTTAGPTTTKVAITTFANGGDNMGVYVPVFATAKGNGVLVYAAVFLVMLAAWCAAGHYLATRRPIALALARWGHILLPIVFIAIGVLVLVEGGAFGL